MRKKGTIFQIITECCVLVLEAMAVVQKEASTHPRVATHLE